MARKSGAGPSGPALLASGVGPERRTEREGGAEAFYSPEHGCLGHLDLRGEFVAHQAPAGFEFRAPDGALVAVPESPAESEEMIDG